MAQDYYPSCGNDFQLSEQTFQKLEQEYRNYRQQFYKHSQAKYFASDFYKKDIEKLRSLSQKVFEREKFLLENSHFIDPETKTAESGILCSDIVSLGLHPKSPFHKYKRVILMKDNAKTKLHAIDNEEFDFVEPRFTKHIDMSDEDFESGHPFLVNSPWLLGCRVDLSHGGKRSHHVYCLVPQFTFGFKHKLRHPYKDSMETRKKRYKELANCGPQKEGRNLSRDRQIYKKTKHYTEIDLECLRYKTLSDRVLVTLRSSATGLVLDEVTGDVIEHAKVSALNEYFDRTKEDGRYQLDDIPLELENQPIQGSHRKFYSGEGVIKKLFLNKVSGDYNITLRPKIINLSGTAYNKKSQKPIKSHTIDITIGYRYRNGSIFRKKFKTKTDSEGRYRIENLYCHFNALELTPLTNAYEVQASDLDLDCSQIESVKDFYLEPATTTIAGLITDQKTGETLTNISVGLYNNNELIQEVDIAEDGSYKIEMQDVPFPYSGELEIKATDKRGFALYKSNLRTEKIIDIKQTQRDYRNQSDFVSPDQVLTYERSIKKDLALKPLFDDVSGIVTHLQTGSPISGQEVELFYRGELRKTTTNSRGEFLFRHVPNGDYSIPVNLDFYQPNTTNFSVNDADVELDIKLSRVDIIGKFVNVEHGGLVRNFEENGTLSASPSISQSNIEINGSRYRIKNVTAAQYKLFASIEGYYPANETTETIDFTKYEIKKDIMMLPIEYAKDRIIIVLTWGENPRDLDSQIANGDILLNYKLISSSHNSLTGGIYAKLDVDDVSSYGPETTIIQLKENGAPVNPKPYEFLVYHYSGSGSLKTSGANVRVYDNGQGVSDIKIRKSDESTSRLWHVLSIVNGNVIVRNQLKFKAEYEKITRLWDDIKAAEAKISKHQESLSKIQSAEAKYESFKLKLREALKTFYAITGDKDVFREIYGPKAKPSRDFKSMLSTVAYNISMSESYEEGQIEQLDASIAKLRAQLETAQNESLKDGLSFELEMLQKTRQAISDGSNEQYKEMAQKQLEELKVEAKKLEVEFIKLDKEIAKAKDEFIRASGNDLTKTDQKVKKLKDQVEAQKKIITKKQEEISEIESSIAKKLSKYR